MRAHRKVLYMEKMFAALLLTAPDVRLQLRMRITSLGSQLTSATSSGHASSSHQTGSRLALELLLSVQRLLQVYVPALFALGYKVRECTWNGRRDGRV